MNVLYAMGPGWADDIFDISVFIGTKSVVEIIVIVNSIYMVIVFSDFQAPHL